MAAGSRNPRLVPASRRRPRASWFGFLLVGVLLAGGGVAGGPAPATLASPRAMIASGGGISQGGAFELRDTVGQPLAHETSTGGAYRLRGGFRVADPGARGTQVFADGFEALTSGAARSETWPAAGR